MKILGTGIGEATEIVTHHMFDARLKKQAGYTLEKSGIAERRFSAPNELQSDLGAKAVCHAIANARIDINTIDLLISACGVQEQALPSTATHIAQKLSLNEGTPAFDVSASCLSFIVALNVANGLLLSGTYKRIAIVSADQPSCGLDWDEPESSLIFGDGAAAVIVELGRGKQCIKAYQFSTFTQGIKYCEIRAGGTKHNPNTTLVEKDFLFHMQGKKLLKLALEKMPAFLDNLYAKFAIPANSIDLVIPHQASHLGMAHMVKKLGFDAKKVVNIYHTHGNQVAASLPTALHEAFSSKRLKLGDRALLIGTGAGMSIGALVLDI